MKYLPLQTPSFLMLKEHKLITSAPPFKIPKALHFLPTWQKPNTVHNLKGPFQYHSNLPPVTQFTYFTFQTIFNYKHICTLCFNITNVSLFSTLLTLIYPSCSPLLCSPFFHPGLEIWYYYSSEHFYPQFSLSFQLCSNDCISTESSEIYSWCGLTYQLAGIMFPSHFKVCTFPLRSYTKAPKFSLEKWKVVFLLFFF